MIGLQLIGSHTVGEMLRSERARRIELIVFRIVPEEIHVGGVIPNQNLRLDALLAD